MTRIAVVTGAATGIGAAVAARLAADGWTLGLVDVTPGDGIRTVDLADGDAVGPALAALISDLGGRLDLVVNNAGFGVERPFFDTPDDVWRQVLAVDLTAPFLVAKACWPALAKPGGSIVNVSSVHGERPNAGQAAYGAAKGGLNTLTRAMAVDAGPYGVRVNAVAPGFVATRLWNDWMDRLGPRAGIRAAQVAEQVPLGGPVGAEDVAAAVAWLAGPDAMFVTGAVLPVDGGLGVRAYQLPDDAE